MQSHSLTHRLTRTARLLIVILFSSALVPSLAQKKNFTLEEVFMSGKFMGKSIRGMKWMKSGDRYSFLETPKDAKSPVILAYNCATDTKDTLLNLSAVKEPGTDTPINMIDYVWSPDETKILFTLNVKVIWRHSRTAQYFVYDVKNGSLKSLSKSEGDVMNAKFSPDSKKVGFVRNNDIFVFEIESEKETQLTTGGTELIHNGKFGWVYEEEFAISDGWQWSPDSKRIAFWQENETNVPEYTLTDWMPLHLELTKLRYPKPGDPNPIEKIGVVDLTTMQTKWMDIGTDTTVYIPRIKWTADPTLLSIQRLNRDQNHLELLFADVATGRTRVVLEERSEGWIDIDDYPMFLGDKKRFVWASERDGWNHLYLHAYNGNQLAQLTKGEWEIDGLKFIDEKNQSLYYVSTEQSPVERHLYSIRFDGTNKTQLSVTTGSHSFDMSPTGAFYVDRYSSVALPTQTILCNNEGEEIKKLIENKGEAYAEYNMSQREMLTFNTSDGVKLYASMIKPPNFSPEKKYPVLFDVYGGPGSQSVRNSWTGLWHQLMAQKGYIVFQMDPRGGSSRGTKFKFATYKRLGTYEVSDFVEGANFLKSLTYIDATRVAIWGWSYGGYAAALAMLKAGDYFKAGIAVAPVTDWRLYDSIYTERYMLQPKDNEEGYKTGSCMEYAKDLKGKLLLVHGGVDDNVHLQNTIQLVDALEKVNKQFDMRIYPNGNHGIGGGAIRLNLYTMMMEFLEKNL